MIKLQQLIGLPVLVIHSGKREGTIKDAIFDSHWNVTGLVLEISGWFANVVKTVELECGADMRHRRDNYFRRSSCAENKA